MAPIKDSLVRLVAAQAGGNQDGDVLLVSRDSAIADSIRTIPGLRVTWLRNVGAADDVDLSVCASVGVVAGQLEHMSSTAGINLLCRLRDCVCPRLVLELGDYRLTAQELLAIGFYPAKRQDGGNRLFRFDRDEFFEPRQWNTPEDWAHPENFNKNRW